MHFVYKTDNLFQSIRISYGNSSVTKRFNFLKLIWTPDFLCVQNAPFKATSSFFNPFWLHLLFFMHLLIILSYKTLNLKSISNELWKGWKLAWYHHFIHIACARKLRELRQKLDVITHKYRGSQQFSRVEYSTQIYWFDSRGSERIFSSISSWVVNSTTPKRLVSASKISVAKWYDSNSARKRSCSR